jgi:hypothetical protein
MIWQKAAQAVMREYVGSGGLIAYGKNLWDQFARKVRLPAIPFGPRVRIPPEGEGVCLDVPCCTQTDFFSCGAVAGWAVIKAIYPERGRAEHAEFYDRCRPDPEEGTPPNRLVNALRSSGVRVTVRRKKPVFKTLKKALDSGFPVIACIDRPGTMEAHWVVVYGYREVPANVGGGQWLFLHNNWRPFVGSEEDTVMPFTRFEALQIGEHLICSGDRSWLPNWRTLFP